MGAYQGRDVGQVFVLDRFALRAQPLDDFGHLDGGYRYDLTTFLRWFRETQSPRSSLVQLTEISRRKAGVAMFYAMLTPALEAVFLRTIRELLSGSRMQCHLHAFIVRRKWRKAWDSGGFRAEMYAKLPLQSLSARP